MKVEDRKPPFDWPPLRADIGADQEARQLAQTGSVLQAKDLLVVACHSNGEIVGSLAYCYALLGDYANARIGYSMI